MISSLAKDFLVIGTPPRRHTQYHHCTVDKIMTAGRIMTIGRKVD